MSEIDFFPPSDERPEGFPLTAPFIKGVGGSHFKNAEGGVTVVWIPGKGLPGAKALGLDEFASDFVRRVFGPPGEAVKAEWDSDRGNEYISKLREAVQQDPKMAKVGAKMLEMLNNAQPGVDESASLIEDTVDLLVKATLGDGWKQVTGEKQDSESLYFEKNGISRSISVQNDQGSVALTDKVLIEGE